MLENFDSPPQARPHACIGGLGLEVRWRGLWLELELELGLGAARWARLGLGGDMQALYVMRASMRQMYCGVRVRVRVRVT